MKTGRNDPCPCGSGKKHKKCCLNKEQFSINTLTIKERNSILFNAIIDIFGFKKNKTWDDLKNEISGEQIRELYNLIAHLWPPKTDLISLLPKPDNKLRSIYLGHYRPESILRSIVRYSLYTDEIIVLLPFLNPWCISPKYNPIEYPEQYKEDTLKSLAFIMQLMPWVCADIVHLIPDPGDFDYKLRIDTFSLAKERLKNLKLTEQDEEEFKPYFIDDFKRFFSRLSENVLINKIKQSNPEINQNEINSILKYINKLQQEDPLALNQPITKLENSQIQITRTGANLEMGLYIAQITGAHIYSDFSQRWKEILSLTNESQPGKEVWSPLAYAFQNLEFQFLNEVSSDFACSIRKDHRLESFRCFLRKIWVNINEHSDSNKINELSRNFSDELKCEHNKAEIEWQEIDKKLLKQTSGMGAIASILKGGMRWEIPATGFCIGAVVELLLARMNRSRFKKTVPMSIFLDLQKINKK